MQQVFCVRDRMSWLREYETIEIKVAHAWERDVSKAKAKAKRNPI